MDKGKEGREGKDWLVIVSLGRQAGRLNKWLQREEEEGGVTLEGGEDGGRDGTPFAPPLLL